MERRSGKRLKFVFGKWNFKKFGNRISKSIENTVLRIEWVIELSRQFSWSGLLSEWKIWSGLLSECEIEVILKK